MSIVLGLVAWVYCAFDIGNFLPLIDFSKISFTSKSYWTRITPCPPTPYSLGKIFKKLNLFPVSKYYLRNYKLSFDWQSLSDNLPLIGEGTQKTQIITETHILVDATNSNLYILRLES